MGRCRPPRMTDAPLGHPRPGADRAATGRARSRQNDRGELVAVASRDRERGARRSPRRHGIPQAFGSYEALLADARRRRRLRRRCPNHLHAAVDDPGARGRQARPVREAAGPGGRPRSTRSPPPASGPAGSRSRRSCTSTTRRSLRAVELARGRRARSARARPRLVLVLPDLPGRPAGRPDDGRRLAVGRRLLPGQPRPPDRRRGAGPDRRLRPVRRARRRPDVHRPAPLPRRPAGPVRQWLRRARPRAGRDRRRRRHPRRSTARSCPSPTARRRIADPVARPAGDADRGPVASTSTRPRWTTSRAAILDGEPPRVGLDFSRGTIATLVDLDRAARARRRLIAG